MSKKQIFSIAIGSIAMTLIIITLQLGLSAFIPNNDLIIYTALKRMSSKSYISYEGQIKLGDIPETSNRDLTLIAQDMALSISGTYDTKTNDSITDVGLYSKLLAQNMGGIRIISNNETVYLDLNDLIGLIYKVDKDETGNENSIIQAIEEILSEQKLEFKRIGYSMVNKQIERSKDLCMFTEISGLIIEEDRLAIHVYITPNLFIDKIDFEYFIDSTSENPTLFGDCFILDGNELEKVDTTIYTNAMDLEDAKIDDFNELINNYNGIPEMTGE